MIADMAEMLGTSRREDGKDIDPGSFRGWAYTKWEPRVWDAIRRHRCSILTIVSGMRRMFSPPTAPAWSPAPVRIPRSPAVMALCRSRGGFLAVNERIAATFGVEMNESSSIRSSCSQSIGARRSRRVSCLARKGDIRRRPGHSWPQSKKPTPLSKDLGSVQRARCCLPR